MANDSSPHPAPRQNASDITFVALGGLGEIGMNCMVIQQGQSAVMIDCGVMFPDGVFGAELIHPDFSYLEQVGDALDALVLTHGHEDHIGAIPFWLSTKSFQRNPVPIYATPYTAALVRDRLKAHALEDAVTIRIIRPRGQYKVGGWYLEPLAVTHSIMDACALVLRSPGGQTLVHSGDFCLDAHPYLGDGYDQTSFERVGQAGVDVLLSDSTNAEVACRAHSEWDVVMALTEQIQQSRGRIVVGLFSSNVARIHGLLAAAQSLGRKVCCLGRSVLRHVGCAEALGYLNVEPDSWVQPEDAQDVPPEKLLVLATGSQGESRAALSKLATGVHPYLRLDANDRVILSSRIIPGNELPVHRMVNQFERKGVRVVMQSDVDAIHTSGHASQEEQALLLSWLRPKSFIPVHGTFRQMQRHAALAVSRGADSTCIAENGDKIRWSEGTLRIEEKVVWGRVHSHKMHTLSADVLRGRAQLARNGVVVAALLFDDDGRLVGLPEISAQGFLGADEDPGWVSAAQSEIVEAIASYHSQQLPKRNDQSTTDVAQRALRRFLRKRFDLQPVAMCIALKGGP